MATRSNIKSIENTGFGFYEPMRKNWFVLEIDGGGIVDGYDAEDLCFACNKCDIPRMTIADNAVHHVNDTMYVPGKASYDSITFTFYEYIKDAGENGHTKNSAGYLLYNWQKLFHDPTTGEDGSKKANRKKIKITQIDGNGDQVRQWSLYNCWPTTVDFESLDSSDGNVQNVTCTIRFDYAVMNEDNLNETAAKID